MAYQAEVRPRTYPYIKTQQGNANMRSRLLKASERVENRPWFHCLESHTRTKLHNSIVYAEWIGQSHVNFLGVCLVSGSPYEPNLVDSVGFVHSVLELSGSYNSFSPFPAGFPKLWSLAIGLHIYFHQLLYKASLMRIRLDSNKWV